MAVKRVSPQDAKALMDQGYAYVDVRSIPEFEAGHPEGAYNVPLAHMGPAGFAPNHEFLHVMTARFPTDAKLVVGCKSGGRSAQAAALLETAGYTQVVDQRAGFDGAPAMLGRGEPGWRPAGLPLETAAPQERTWEGLKKAAK